MFQDLKLDSPLGNFLKDNLEYKKIEPIDLSNKAEDDARSDSSSYSYSENSEVETAETASNKSNSDGDLKYISIYEGYIFFLSFLYVDLTKPFNDDDLKKKHEKRFGSLNKFYLKAVHNLFSQSFSLLVVLPLASWFIRLPTALFKAFLTFITSPYLIAKEGLSNTCKLLVSNLNVAMHSTLLGFSHFLGGILFLAINIPTRSILTVAKLLKNAFGKKAEAKASEHFANLEAESETPGADNAFRPNASPAQSLKEVTVIDKSQSPTVGTRAEASTSDIEADGLTVPAPAHETNLTPGMQPN